MCYCMYQLYSVYGFLLEINVFVNLLHQVIAELAEESDLEVGRIYPPLANIHEVSTNLAAKVVEYAYSNNIACTYPEPMDKLAFVRAHQYSLEYESFVPHVYSWPQNK